MIRFRKIVTIRIAPPESETDWLSVRCLGGTAKWLPESCILSLKADVLDDEIHEKWLGFLASKPVTFKLEVDYQTGDSPEAVHTKCFSKCREATLEFRSATIRPKGTLPAHRRVHAGVQKANSYQYQ
jgi:hypothetical protein